MKKIICSKNKKGFTLIELLVVISIIAILLAVGAVSYSTSVKKSRDARKRADIDAVAKVLEQCYQINSYDYPSISGGSTDTISTSCTGGPSISVTTPDGSLFRVNETTGVGWTIRVGLEIGATANVQSKQE